MAEQNDYISRLNKARKKREKKPYPIYIAVVVVVIAIVTVILFAGRAQRKPASSNDPIQASAAGSEPAETEADVGEEIPETRSAAELAREQEDAAKQAVVDGYENLGLVQVSGYLNVRETASAGGEIVGKLQQNSACEILANEGEWYHISSGGLQGYIHQQFVIAGDEAREKALEYVSRRAIVKTTGFVNIRKEPVIDPTNVVGKALANERYEVIAEADGWIQIDTGYISADYCEVTYALNEARKMDLRAMAIDHYENLLISKVSGYLNIRNSAEDKGMENVIGKLPSKAAGEIIETVDGWYKIKSGSIVGYVTANPEYVALGQEARDLAMESASLMAIVNTDKLNVRPEPSVESKIWTQISKEERYPVAEQLDGWIQIELDAGEGDADKAFISTRDNNVEVRYALDEAIKFSPLEEAANRNSSLRNKVVNYALQFVGNRYVWGGTNPNTGADCSGFVQYVMRNAAGVSIPRTSREQAKTGRTITSSEMRPGDLIYYTNSSGTVNHVAMYMGNGQVVHAASTRSGIRISTWNYRTPKYIRSYLD